MNNREAFISWAESRCYYLDASEDGHYIKNSTALAWEIWQAALASQQDHIPDVGKMVQAQQTESKPVMPVGFLDHGGIFYSYREKIKDGTELYVKSPAPEGE